MMCTKHHINYDKFFLLLICICPLVIIVYCFSSGINGNDFWWHIKVGENILMTKAVPTKDIFSWYGTALGIDWTAHEWLSDVLFYIVFKLFGNIGIFLLSVLASCGLYGLMLGAGKKYIRKNVLLSGVFFSLFAVLTSLFFYGRPHIFSFFLLYFELKILYEFYENPETKAVYCLPVIAVIWSNMHGGSSNLSYILCIIFLAVGLVDCNYGRIEAKRFRKEAAVKLTIVTVLTVLGLLINPIGYRVIIYPYTNMSDTLSMTLISEWRAPDAKVIGNLILYFLPIFLMTIGLIAEKKKIRLIDLVVMFAFLFLFFRSARFIILWYIAAVFYAFRYMPELKIKSVTSRRDKCAVWLIVLFYSIIVAMGIKDTVSTYMNDELIIKAVSDEAMGVIKEDAPERIFNDYNLGEALIFYDIPVFFDARADLYAQNNIMADGVSLMFLEQANSSSKTAYVDVNMLIEKYNFDAIVILKTRPLYSYIVSHPEKYELIYDEAEVAYYRIAGGKLYE